LVKVDGLFTYDFYVSDTQPDLKVIDGSIKMEKKEISSFKDQAITFSLQATKAGTFTLSPRVIYKDETEELKILTPKQIRITVQPKRTLELKPEKLQTAISGNDPSALQLEKIPNQQQIDFEFKTEVRSVAKKTFDYLTGSFVLDYMRRRLPLEWSGWRTLVEIADSAKVSYRSLYGDRVIEDGL